LQARTLLGNVGLLVQQDLKPAASTSRQPSAWQRCHRQAAIAQAASAGQADPPVAEQQPALRSLFNEAKTLFELLHACESPSPRWNDDCFCIGLPPPAHWPISRTATCLSQH
jgi:hypothetical protein